MIKLKGRQAFDSPDFDPVSKYFIRGMRAYYKM